jgi:NADPH2:quinone reductase
MKAIQYERFGGLSAAVRHVPTCPGREMLVQTVSIGVNFPDIRERLGVCNRPETKVGVTLPNVSGLAVTGRVVGVGDGVDRALVGQASPRC